MKKKKKNTFHLIGTMHRGFLFFLFCKLQQRYFDLYVKNKFLKNYIPGPSFFFLELVPDLKPGSCCSVLGLATNQKKYKHT